MERLGGLLGRLGPILDVLERSLGVSGASWAVLTASWGPLLAFDRSALRCIASVLVTDVSQRIPLRCSALSGSAFHFIDLQLRC